MANKPKIKVAKIAAQAEVILSKRIALADYKPHPRNYNRHPDSQIADIAESLKQFGQVKPIVVWRDSIIAGHGVALAAQKLGWTKLDARVLPSKWRETKALAYLAADNELARRGDPDEAQLAQIVKDIADAEGEALAQLAAGEAKALRELLTIANPKEETADAGETELRLAPKRVSLGEIWQLGRHRISCIDSTDTEKVAQLLDGAKPTFVWCDPPYGIKIVKNGKVGGGNLAAVGTYAPVIGDDDTKTARYAVSKFFPMGGLQIWWGANYYADSFMPSPCWIVWDKRGDMPSNNFADCEVAWCSDNSPSRVYRQVWAGMIREGEHDKRIHPNQKPVALAVWCFERYGKPNDIIFDGFLGSGISVLAAEQMNDGRTVYGADLAPEYCDWTIARWEKATGLVAQRLT